MKSVFKKAVKSVKKAYNTAKAVVTAAKPIVKQTVTSTAKTVAKATYQNTVVKSAETVYKATKAASQNLENNSTALKESGWAGNIFANVSKGILDTVENTAGGFYNLANDPLGTVSESVNYFKEDPLRHNIAGSVWSYYQDISRASYVHDWDTVEYKLGSGLINLAGFAAVGGKTESVVKTKLPNGIQLKNIPVPRVLMADTGLGTVPVITTVPITVTIPSTVVAGTAGVANAAAAGQVVYSVAGGPKQSGDITNYRIHQTSKNSSIYNKTGYLPVDADGNPISLRKQSVNGQDIPLPDPAAQGHAHTVIGGKVSSKTGEIYKQTATFPEGAWPNANGHNVPWSEVHWSNHGRGDHLNLHQHIFEYNPDKGGWIRGGPTFYDRK